jgi:hypothetical protein
MTITIDGTKITLPDGTTKNNARFRQFDTNTQSLTTSYAIGTYLLIDLQYNSSYTNPVPLDGWSNPTGLNPAAPYLTNSQYPQAWRPAHNNPGNIIGGTWYSRGSSLFQALIVRVA